LKLIGQTTGDSGPKESVLEEAQRLVGGARQGHYGPPEENVPRIAALWSAYLGVPVSSRQYCDLMMLMKLGRSATGGAYLRDTYVDLAGYALCAERCHDAGQGG
jgi:hypothetical protein